MPWVLYQNGTITNPNCLLAGVVGRGKSMLAKAIATRSIATGRKVYVPGDPKGEWSVVARTIGGAAIELGAGPPNRPNPLDEGPRPAAIVDQTRATIRQLTAMGATSVTPCDAWYPATWRTSSTASRP